MKRITRFLVAAALTAAAVELQTNPTAAVQPSTSRPSQTGYVLKQIPFSAVHHQQVGAPRIRLRESTSGNWSGYAVPLETSGVTDTFSVVQGTWTVPTVTGSRSATYSSTWVGLDGYDSGTVEQIGTEQDWMGRGRQNYAWFEMYPSGAYEIEGFPVNPGDSISAQVHYLGQRNVQVGRGRSEVESVFQLTIVNTTRNVSYSVPTSYTTVTSAARASAEWVVEAPSSRKVLPLADFGTVNFSGCEAASVHTGGILAPIGSWTPDPLTMIDPSGGRSVPSSLSANGEAFSVSWSAK
ncbi:MAG: G1 family glutamic endopeptidase [Verrucomicrobiia bacterium]